MEDLNGYCTTEQYAKMKGVSANVVLRKIQRGNLPARKISGRYYIKIDEPYIDYRKKRKL